MKKSRFSEGQIIGVLREQEAGSKTEDVCRKHGISQQTFYRWKSKYGGMSVSDAQKLKTLEDENRRLKKLLAESMLDVPALKTGSRFFLAQPRFMTPPRAGADKRTLPAAAECQPPPNGTSSDAPYERQRSW